MAARKQAAAGGRKTTRGTVKRGAQAATRQVPTGGMTVREAGRKGGLIGGRKGGETVLRERGPGFYSQIGKKGGQRVRELIERAKRLEARPAGTRAAGGAGRRRTTRAR